MIFTYSYDTTQKFDTLGESRKKVFQKRKNKFERLAYEKYQMSYK